MTIFNNAFPVLGRITICNCWIKSECLGLQQTQFLCSIVRSLMDYDNVEIDLIASNNMNVTATDSVIDAEIVRHFHNAFSSTQFSAHELRTQLHEILDAVSNLGAKSEYMVCLILLRSLTARNLEKMFHHTPRCILTIAGSSLTGIKTNHPMIILMMKLISMLPQILLLP